MVKYHLGMSIIIFLIILALLILVHEFGHFIVAKRSGIKVDEFGLGFPPKLFSKRIGETLYTLNAIPFGGFVKILGEDPEVAENMSTEDRKRSFQYKPKWVQSLVLVAGVAFNVIFAWLLISLGFMIGLPSSVDHPGYGNVQNIHTVVTEVMAGSPASVSGLSEGDVLTSISSSKEVLTGNNITPEAVGRLIGRSTGDVHVSFKHGQASKEINITPNSTIIPGKVAIGIAMDEVGILKVPVHIALIDGAILTWSLLKATTVGILSFVGRIFILKSDFSQVSGPVGILNVVGEAQSLGFIYLLSLTALISINLAIINLLPFPALDGGRLLFVLIEKIRGRALPTKFVRYANTLGFALLLILMIFVTIHDIWKL